ncbi:MAG: subclass B1 metallo-beta-lactamase [Flavobacteriales bacterium]|nr:subclass B1 metallo-beta-lactamase [Flavobacteriales bacterium]
MPYPRRTPHVKQASSFIGTALGLCLIIACVPKQSATSTTCKTHHSEQLIINRIGEHSLIHTSYHQTEDFGNVPCNILVVHNDGQAIIFDTPTNDAAAEELIRWVKDSLKCTIMAVVPTHFHVDCLGGLGAFHVQRIPSYAHAKTMALASAAGTAAPQHAFNDTIRFTLGDEQVEARFFGEGHTADNVVGYFPAECVLFSGCLIKELDASKGYLGDANVAAWSGTVERVKQAYPQVKLIVPGHGAHGDGRLLDYTIGLFR